MFNPGSLPTSLDPPPVGVKGSNQDFLVVIYLVFYDKQQLFMRLFVFVLI